MRCMTEKINSFDFYVPMDIPLVLEGGAMRGVFEAGVLDVFIEKGLRFRKVVVSRSHAGNVLYVRTKRTQYPNQYDLL